MAAGCIVYISEVHEMGGHRIKVEGHVQKIFRRKEKVPPHFQNRSGAYELEISDTRINQGSGGGKWRTLGMAGRCQQISNWRCCTCDLSTTL